MKNILYKFPRAFFLVMVLLGTLLLDFIAYSFLSACPACTSFSQFVTTQSAVSASILTSLSALFSLTGKRK